MQKPELISALTNAKNNYLLVLAASACFANEKSYQILNESHCKFDHYAVSFDQVANMMSNPADRDIAVSEFIRMGLRALVKEGYQVVYDYCKETNQLDNFRGATWYHFARLIRNSLSHNFKFVFSKIDLPVLPVTWSNKTIKTNMRGCDLMLDFFGYKEAWELFKEFCDFAENEID